MNDRIDHLMKIKDAAKYLDVSEAFLNRDRWNAGSIPYIRLGSRTIRYRKCDLDNYIRSKEFYSASGY